MTTNIIDKWKRQNRRRKIYAVIENTWRDTTCEQSDRVAPSPVLREHRDSLSVEDAIIWTSADTTAFTHNFYDKGNGI